MSEPKLTREILEVCLKRTSPVERLIRESERRIELFKRLDEASRDPNVPIPEVPLEGDEDDDRQGILGLIAESSYISERIADDLARMSHENIVPLEILFSWFWAGWEARGAAAEAEQLGTKVQK